MAKKLQPSQRPKGLSLRKKLIPHRCLVGARKSQGRPKLRNGPQKREMARAKQFSAVVLLSAGLDSAFNLFKALKEFDVKLALTFDYGQRAAAREIRAASRMALHLQIPHQVIELPWFQNFASQSSLISGNQIPLKSEVNIENRECSLMTAKSVWVPNRNGIFLNIAAGFAEGLGAKYVIPGFNLEEAQTFPDNSEGFLQSLDRSLTYSTALPVRTHCYSIALNKAQIVAEGIDLGLPFAQLWPCYLDGDLWCGECESCQRFARALAFNQLSFTKLRGS